MRLPKGHVEPGESHRQAALREVREEAGLLEVEVLADLGHQTVEFDWRDVHHVRCEHYYLMMARNPTSSGEPEAQFRPRWLRWGEALDEVTFDAEREWIRRARSAWEKHGERV
jgi:ADP-ribose pyrophosphatase YjhB (NUDIX family)